MTAEGRMTPQESARATVVPDAADEDPPEISIARGDKLARRLCAVMASMSKIEKTGKNPHHGYAYIEQGAVMAAVRPALARHGVMLLPQVHEVATFGKGLLIRMTFTLINADDPSDVLVAEWYAEGQDTQDKAITKATTNAEKYFLIRLLLLSDKDDPDADGPVAVEAAGVGVRREPATTPAAPGPARATGTAPLPTPNGQRRRTPATPTPGATLDSVAGDVAAAGVHDKAGHPTATARTVEQAKADLKEACLRVGLPAPLTLREVNMLARAHGVDVVGSSAGVTPAWLDRLRAALPDIPVGPLDRGHMSDKANALAALRATCGALGRPEPRSLDALNALAGDAGMGILASWDNVSAGWLEAIRRHVGARAGTTEAPAQRHTTEAQSQRSEQSLAGWIAAAPDRATLEQLSSDVHRAHEAGSLSQGVAEALLEAVDARTAELDLYGAGAAAADERGAASAELSGAEEVEARAAG